MSYIATGNICDVLIHRLSKNDKATLKKYCDNSFKISKEHLLFSKQIPEVDPNILKYNSDKLTDYYEGAKSLYQILKISPAQASDQRLWTFMTHNVFSDYMVKLRPINEKTTGAYIIEHYFCKGAKSLVYNDIALLWWLFYLTDDELNKNDRYHLTKEVFSMRDYTRHLFSGKQGRSKEFRNGLIEYVIENPKTFASRKAEKVRFIMVKMNSISGSSLLSCYTKNEIKNLIKSFKDEIELV